MIHYHGLPITPDIAAIAAIKGGHAFVSYAYPNQLSIAVEVSQSFAVDNGAFSAWKKGSPVKDWTGYYKWVSSIRRIPGFDFAVIPDVIDGSEKDNDDLLSQWPGNKPSLMHVGAPVWHMHESTDRLKRLCRLYPRVCLGSSGEFSTVGNNEWWARISEAMDSICCENGYPSCKIHGLRMLNPKIFSKLPLSSADSTNIARNIGIDKKWNGAYAPPNKAIRAEILRHRIESQQSSKTWIRPQGSISTSPE